MILRAPAKINLYLKVLRKRPDGYHSIETLFERIDLCDRIVLRSLKRDTIRIFCDHPGVPTGKAGLMYRAVGALKKAYGIRKGVEVRISKKIPVAAELGGGSSDAAAVLLGLNRLWKISPGTRHLVNIARRLGADVPFFLGRSSFAIAGERGDDVKALRWPRLKLWHLVVYSPVKVLSGDIYRMYSKKRYSTLTKYDRSNRIHLPGIDSISPKNVPQLIHNDLEELVIKKEPVVDKIKRALREAGAMYSLVSGSGPSVFSLFEKRREAIKVKDALTRRFPFVTNKGWQIFIVPTL